MKIFLIRHGKEDDKTTGLSELGRDEVVSAALFLKDNGNRFGFSFKTALIHTSKLKRATESADILSKILMLAPAIQENWLVDRNHEISYGELTKLIQSFQKFITDGSMIVVTHLPNISDILGECCRSWGYDINDFKIPNGSIYYINPESHSIRKIH